MKKTSRRFLWRVGNLPFIFRPLSKPYNGGGLPDWLPFSLKVDPANMTLRQVPSLQVSSALKKAYSRGSAITGTLSDDNNIGQRYTDDFIGFMQSSIKNESFLGKRILDIGCGTGYLLYRLKLLGAEVLGIEPGRLGLDKADVYRVPIIRTYFPSNKINKGKFDIIIIYSVLEHIEDSLNWLKSVRDILHQEGDLFVSVPDCAPYLESGDVSILFHEHWSYFTHKSPKRILSRVFGPCVRIQRAGFGGSLYSRVRHSNEKRRPIKAHLYAEEDQLIEQARKFKQLALKNNEKLERFMRQLFVTGKTLGIYVPYRAINALTMKRIPLDHCRFFNDNPLLHGTYLPGENIPIEKRDDLIKKPTQAVLIATRSFGEQIANHLRQQLPTRPLIKTWSEISKQ